MKTYSQRLALLLSLLLSVSAPAWAGVTLHAAHGSVNSTTTATSNTIGAFAVSNGDTIVIIVAFGAGGSTASGITDGLSDTYTKCTACTATNTARVEVWTAKVTANSFAGTINPTVTYTAGSKASFSESSWAGVDSIVTTINGTTSSSANPTVNLTTSDPYNNACITGFAGPTTTTGSAGTHGTLDTSFATSATTPAYLAVMHNNVASAGTCTTDLTDANATWAIAQIELRSSQWAAGTGGALQSVENASCAAAGTTCTITLSTALGAGHLLLVTTGSGGTGNTSTAIASITDNGSSANSYTIDADAQCFDSTGGESSNMAYVLSTNSGAATTITVTLDTASSVTWQASAVEVPYDSSISPITFDTSSQLPQAASTSHTVTGLTLHHTNEFIYQAIKTASGSASTISSPFIIGSSSAATNTGRAVANSYDATTAWTTTSVRACLGVEAFSPAQTGTVGRHRSITY